MRQEGLGRFSTVCSAQIDYNDQKMLKIQHFNDKETNKDGKLSRVLNTIPKQSVKALNGVQ